MHARAQKTVDLFVALAKQRLIKEGDGEKILSGQQ